MNLWRRVTMTMRVVVADDHQPVRAGIVALLGDIAGVEVVGEVADGFAAVERVAELHPHFLFLDVDMPGKSGLETLAEIHAAYPALCVIVLSVHGGEELVLRARKLGAAGFVRKDEAPDQLAPAIAALCRGATWFPAAVAAVAAVSGVSAVSSLPANHR